MNRGLKNPRPSLTVAETGNGGGPRNILPAFGSTDGRKFRLGQRLRRLRFQTAAGDRSFARRAMASDFWLACILLRRAHRNKNRFAGPVVAAAEFYSRIPNKGICSKL